MYKNKRFLAIIPARAGSRGIKNKNVIDLCGKPLIAYSIEVALKSKYIDRVIVSTNCKEIADVAKKYGADVPFLRPDYLALDTSKTIECVIHCIEQLHIYGDIYDYIVLLQPTQPLRESYHIDEAVELIVQKDSDSLVSICKVKEHPILMRTLNEDNSMSNLLNISSTQRRQDFKEYYRVNGVIYINKINENLNLNTSLNDNKLPYIMDEKYSVDIDEILDLKIAKIMMKEIALTKEK